MGKCEVVKVAGLLDRWDGVYGGGWFWCVVVGWIDAGEGVWIIRIRFVEST